MRHKWSILLGFPLAVLTVAGGCFEKRDTEKSQNRVELATGLLRSADYVGAEAEAKKALAFDPKNEQAENLLGLIRYFQAQETVRLIEVADCMAGSDGDGLRAEADQKMRSADERYQRAVDLAPDYGDAWLNRGVVAMYFHDWDKAIAFLERALQYPERMDPANLQVARADLGWAHYQKQDYVHALTDLVQANQGNQYFCVGKYWLASTYYARKEFELVAETLAPMLKDPKLCGVIPGAFYTGGQALLRLHNPTGAARALKACVDAAPKSCQARECTKALANIVPEAKGEER